MSDSPVQRFSLGLDGSGKPRLVYDMLGEIVRFEDHARALGTERKLADSRVEEAHRATTAAPPSPPPDFHDSRKQLYAAVEALRELGWSDGGIIFGAELNPESPTSFIAPAGGKDQ